MAEGLLSAPSRAAVRLSGRDRVVVRDMYSTGAVAFRPTPRGVWVIGAAAHPIGGDRSFVRVSVGAGCRAVIRSAAATIARWGPGGPSVTATAVRVSTGGTLEWSPEPGVAACGCDHLVDTRIRLAPDAGLSWRDEVVLGRHDEGPGTWRSRLRLTVGSRVVLASEIAAGPQAPGWSSSAVLAGARAVSTLVVARPGFIATPAVRANAVALPLAGGAGAQITAWGDDLTCCRAAVESLRDEMVTVCRPAGRL